MSGAENKGREKKERNENALLRLLSKDEREENERNG
jgi:hypothetical protein